MRRFKLAALFVIVLVAAAVVASREIPAVRYKISPPAASHEITLIEHPRTAAQKIVNGAKQQAIDQVRYDASYLQIPYPNGDVPKNRGACTDVIVRALRNAGYDLQKLMHEDMARHFRLYPQQWHMAGPDSNIDHRRVPNHIAFMKRFAKSLPCSTGGENLKTWKPGDLVYWRLAPTSLTHCGVVSDEKNADGLPLVIHNIGPTARQEDCLDSWPIIGHFRYPG